MLLVRSDDMGVVYAVNEACLENVNRGLLGPLRFLVPGPWFFETVQMLNANPDIDVGVHLDLTSEWSDLNWGSVSKNVPSLVDENGHFYPATQQRPRWPKNTGFLGADWKIEEVERELRAQIEMVLRLLPNVTHLSAHMGTAVSTPELTSLTK
jgi:chitin disaccharide deacetylase